MSGELRPWGGDVWMPQWLRRLFGRADAGDTPERMAAAARVITAIDKARPEVIIDVELLEVDRTRLQEYGLQIASPGRSTG